MCVLLLLVDVGFRKFKGQTTMHHKKREGKRRKGPAESRPMHLRTNQQQLTDERSPLSAPGRNALPSTQRTRDGRNLAIVHCLRFGAFPKEQLPPSAFGAPSQCGSTKTNRRPLTLSHEWLLVTHVRRLCYKSTTHYTALVLYLLRFIYSL